MGVGSLAGVTSLAKGFVDLNTYVASPNGLLRDTAVRLLNTGINPLGVLQSDGRSMINFGSAVKNGIQGFVNQPYGDIIDGVAEVGLGTLAGAGVTRLGGVGSVSMRERVLANIAESEAGRASSNFRQFVKTEGQLQEKLGIWPPNSGGYSPISNVTLDVGTALDRYGFPGGNFVSPQGTSFVARALPSAYETTKPYFQYEVMQPITGVTQAKILPWFGQQGMGTQFQLPETVQWYLKNEYLKQR